MNIISQPGYTVNPADFRLIPQIPYPQRSPSLGEHFASGLKEGLGDLINDFGQEMKAKRRQSLIDKELAKIPANAPAEAQMKAILSNQYLLPQEKQIFGSFILNKEKTAQKQAQQQAFARAFSPQMQQQMQQTEMGNAPSISQQGMQNEQQQIPETVALNTEPPGISQARNQIQQFDQALGDPNIANVLNPQQIIAIQNQKNSLQKAISDFEKQKLAQKNFNLQERKFEASEQGKKEKQLKPFLDKITTSNDASLNILNSVDKMRGIRERGNLGISSPIKGYFSPETRADRGAYDTYGSQLLTLFKTQFPRGITQGEFAKIEEKWLPKSNNSDERNEQIENAYEDIARTLSKKADILETYRNEDGSLPSNIETLVNKEMANEVKNLKDKLLYSNPSTSVGESFETLPSPTQFKKNDIIEEDNGTRYIHTGKGWKKIGK